MNAQKKNIIHNERQIFDLPEFSVHPLYLYQTFSFFDVFKGRDTDFDNMW